MLNEGFQLRRNLDQNAFQVPMTHPDVKKPGRNAGYRVRLDQDGRPSFVEELTAETMASLWCHREGKQNAFPVIRVQRALFDIPVEDPLRGNLDNLGKNNDSERIHILAASLTEKNILLHKSAKDMWNRMRKKARDWQKLFPEEQGEFASLGIMLRRFGDTVLSPAQQLACLAGLVIDRLQDGQLRNVQLAQKLLVRAIKKNFEEIRAEIPLAFDIDRMDCQIPLFDPRMESHVSGRLSEATPTTKNGLVGMCAITGVECTLLPGRFPEPNLGHLGETKLFSRNKATRCESRYGMTGARSFPVGDRVASDIADGLKAITTVNLRGRTWRTVANGKREKKDLLIVYIEGQPVIEAHIADTFGSDEGEYRNQFENDAEAVCDALEGVFRHRPASRLHLLILGKVDKEKKQILLHITPSVRELLDAVERWQRAVRQNLPQVTIPLPPEQKGEKEVWASPVAPYPDQVVRLLASQWTCGGTEERNVNGPELREVLNVMLRAPHTWETAVERLLDMTRQRIGPLLAGVGAVLNLPPKERKKRWKDFPPESRKSALRAVALLGILLDALGRDKETYMKDTAFNLGRLLSLADTLHREYCVRVRKGQGDKSGIPPQLIGNALMSAAADNPEDAIDRLRERMGIYQAWANKGEGKEYALAKWAVGQMGLICRDIERPLPANTNNRFRAELFLGYMARSPEKELPTEESSNDEQE